MSKLNLFDLCIVSNYIKTSKDYIKLLFINKKFGNLNEYFNQFKAYPPFEDDNLFTQKYIKFEHEVNCLNVENENIRVEFNISGDEFEFWCKNKSCETVIRWKGIKEIYQLRQMMYETSIKINNYGENSSEAIIEFMEKTENILHNYNINFYSVDNLNDL